VTPAFVGLDWGTSALRAYLITRSGSIVDDRQSMDGIIAAAGRFENALDMIAKHWPSELPVMAAGMIGSRQGWLEAPYCACPAGLSEIAGSLVSLMTSTGRKVVIVPGLSFHDEAGVPDVIRGEETQVFGALYADRGAFLLPGTHSKWLWVEDGRVVRFATFMTGEAYAALRHHTILSRLTEDERSDPDAFRAGVTRGFAAPELLLHTIFGTRTLGLFGTIAPAALPSYLSGVLIGSEIAAAARHLGHAEEELKIIGSQVLGTRYLVACRICGVAADIGATDAAARGLARIAAAAGLLE
jgi:2-dehydro-3-deoxygalactonokinase